MTGFLFAASPLSSFVGLAILVMLAFVALKLLLPPQDTRRKGLSAVFVAFLSGPVVGFLLACLYLSRNEVNPLDVGDTFAKFLVVGGVAGIIAGVATGLAILIRSP